MSPLVQGLSGHQVELPALHYSHYGRIITHKCIQVNLTGYPPSVPGSSCAAPAPAQSTSVLQSTWPACTAIGARLLTSCKAGVAGGLQRIQYFEAIAFPHLPNGQVCDHLLVGQGQANRQLWLRSLLPQFRDLLWRAPVRQRHPCSRAAGLRCQCP